MRHNCLGNAWRLRAFLLNQTCICLFLDSSVDLKQTWRKGKVGFRQVGLANTIQFHCLKCECRHHRVIDDASNKAK